MMRLALFQTSSDSPVGDIAMTQPGVRSGTLVMLRWIAIFGQMVALAVIARFFGYPLQSLPALLVIGASVLLNIALGMIYPANRFLSGRESAAQLAFDLLQLSALLFLTGGLANPFAVLVLVPVTISATLLSLRSTLGLFGMAVLALSALGLWAYPLPWAGPVTPLLPRLYEFGEWVALIIGMGFLSAYAWRVSAEARRRRQALVATQAALARAQQMSAVGSLAAAAAHELGSPLGTITLVVKDLLKALGRDPHYGDDVRLLDEQVNRCREILAGISKQTHIDEHFASADIEAILHEVMRPYESGTKTLELDIADNALGVTVERTPELLHALDNFIANAVRHASLKINISIEQNADTLQLRIVDDGTGFPADLLPRLGEPYAAPLGSKPQGMGLGIFIASTLLERIGATVHFNNRSVGRQSGAVVDILWPRPYIVPEKESV